MIEDISKQKDKRARQLYVVVQYVPGAEPETFVGKAWKRDEALRIFAGLLAEAPAGTFGPHSRVRAKVVTVEDHQRYLRQVAEAALVAL